MRTSLSIIAALLAATPLAAQTVPKDQGDRYSGAPGASRSAVIAQNGMAATSQPLATQVALDTLKAGGSAVDAAIAANATLGLMEPTGNGIGGDLFAIIWDPKTRKLYGLNASGRAPMGQSLKQLQQRTAKTPRSARDTDGTIADWGAASVTVPGAVDGWFEMHAKFGKLPMQRVLAPSIRYAQQGFPVSELIAQYWKSNTAGFEALHKEGVIEEIANMRRVYMPGGKAPAEGAIFKNPDLALTLMEIAEGGREAFYKGSLARSMDQYFRRIGAPHRYEDFASHKSEWVEPVSTSYRGYDVWEIPPNGQGIAALQILNILEGYDLKAMGRGSVDFWHVFIEAKKRAFADRARYYADPAFAKIPLQELLSKERAAKQRATIDMGRAALADPALPVDGGNDTIYMTVADKDGMMVSLIQSNYRGMGSGLVPDDGNADPAKRRTLGFMFQDRGAQFSLNAKHANAYAPGKRPFHTIIPAFMTKDGKPLLSFGVMGGAMQPQGHAQIVVNMVDFGMTVQAAGDVARFHHDGSTDPEGGKAMAEGGMVEIESGVPQAIADELGKRGHKVKYSVGPYGGYQAIWRDPATGTYWGASEFRKDGQAAGY
ncbi:MAG: gamma-glutamyltransferase [Sphingomonadales bacterium]|jgi:gamma-glutamyltranspeptidase/glutathione hydrolase|nr:gamma-glutamyltransferase [Sphingomonadales bacterium]MBK9004713.1 gamma-glutamyltransferase [Sphingomonadales bacterium]MBK9269896.1 gamma-glutamyltransferase [Sphingomonadales bacterium]MBP6434677.1 gamma-glutamyltransferase [Sphingorhabdus sp.]